jgi:alkylated DNA nucleotide flippase Atl1
MVLLHSSWKFNDLAGVVTLLMIIVVISGFGGRFIYTAVPRTADGVVLDAEQIESQIAGIEAQLQSWLAAHPASSGEIPRRIGSHPEARSRGAGQVLSQSFRFGREKLAWWRAIRHMGAREKAQLRQLERLVDQRDRLRRQLGSLASMRKLLSYWHVFHIPIGLGLFFLAFLHAGTAIYFTILAK